MKLKKRKLKFAAIFGLCWIAVLVLLVDGVVGFEKWQHWWRDSYALAESVLWLLVLLPTVVVYFLTRDTK